MSDAFLVRAYPCMAALPAAARALHDAALTTNPFLSTLWLESFEALLVTPQQQPSYLVIETRGAVCAVVPLLVERHALLGAYRVRALANFYTSVFSALHADLPADTAAMMADALAAHLRHAWPRLALVEIAPLRGDTGLLSALPAALRRHGFSTRRYVAHGNWYEVLDGADMATYLAARPGALRSTLVRKRRTLEREQGCVIEIHGEPQAIAAHMDDYRRVYEASWKSAERSPAFIDRVMVGLAAAGRARLGLLRVGGHAAAGQIWIKMGAVWAVFKLAYDPAYARYSVGSLLMAAMIEAFLAEGDVSGLDFLSGDDPYKQDWASQRREHWGFEALAGHSLAGRLLRFKRRRDGIALSSAA